MSPDKPKICIVSDGTDTILQSRELAMRLTIPENIIRINRDEDLTTVMSSRAKPRDLIYKSDPSISTATSAVSTQDDTTFDFPDLAIGLGFNVTEALVKIKELSGGKTKIAVILDPLAHYEKFDFIILPSYEPYKIEGQNVIRTTGLVNFVNCKYLNTQKAEYDSSEKYAFLRGRHYKHPILTVMIGGRHTGGNIDAEDAELLAKKINEIVKATKGTAFITTSPRTELQVAGILHDRLDVPYFLYDYKVRESDNPYGVFLSSADEIIVTGESVRMMSEACSTGKPVRIYRPREYGFQYKPFVDELINGGHAIEFDSTVAGPVIKLDEAGRVAEIIKKTF